MDGGTAANLVMGGGKGRGAKCGITGATGLGRATTGMWAWKPMVGFEQGVHIVALNTRFSSSAQAIQRAALNHPLRSTAEGIVPWNTTESLVWGSSKKSEKGST